MEHKISTTNKGKKESQNVKARTKIDAGLRINVSENVKLDDIRKALEEEAGDLRFNVPELSRGEKRISLVFVPIQFSDEDMEQTESKSVSEHLKKLNSIDTDELEQQLAKTAIRLMAKGIPGVGLIFPVLASHTTSPAN